MSLKNKFYNLAILHVIVSPWMVTNNSQTGAWGLIMFNLLESNGFIPSAVTGLQIGRVDGHNMHNGKKDSVFSWTDVHERDPTSPMAAGKNHLVNFLCFFKNH